MYNAFPQKKVLSMDFYDVAKHLQPNFLYLLQNHIKVWIHILRWYIAISGNMSNVRKTLPSDYVPSEDS